MASMDLPLSVPQPAATEHGFQASRSLPIHQEAASCRTYSHEPYPAVVTQSSWRRKIAWIPQRVFGYRNGRVNPSSHDMTSTSVSEQPTQPPSENESSSLPSTRRRLEVGAWVREPARKRHASNGVRTSYKKAFEDRVVRKNVITSLVLGILLITLVSICMFSFFFSPLVCSIIKYLTSIQMWHIP